MWLADTPVLLLGQAADERIVDNSDTANVAAVGAWPASTALGGYLGPDHQTHGAGTSDSFTWRLNPPSSQSFRLYVRHAAAAAFSTAATYTVTHGGGTATVILNQQSGGGQWRQLGTYTFSPAAGHSVKLAAPASGAVSADAVKIVPVNQQASVFFLHADQIDAPRIVQDSLYRNRWAWDADGFGQLPPNENPAGLGSFTFNLRMPGQYYDAESGLFYNHFRDYDPQSGRYVESDPIGLAGGINTYSYVGGSPIRRIDRRGLQFTYYDPNPNLNTVICDGNGGVAAQLGPNQDPCVTQCIKEHEQCHIQDLLGLGGSPCAGKSYGTIIGFPNVGNSELKCTQVERECLKNSNPCIECIDSVQSRLQQIQNYTGGANDGLVTGGKRE